MSFKWNVFRCNKCGEEWQSITNESFCFHCGSKGNIFQNYEYDQKGEVMDKESESIVFCWSCKHRTYAGTIGGGRCLMCKSNPKILRTPIAEYWDYEYCKLKNQNNNCPEYEPDFYRKVRMGLSSLWYGIKLLFQKDSPEDEVEKRRRG